jgi:hypothetical protein
MGALNLGLNQMKRTEGGTGARKLSIRCNDDHVAEPAHCSSEHMEPDRIDAVIVGQKNSHGSMHSPSK